MPIVDMQFKNGIFYAREFGRIDREDAQAWAQQLAEYASHHPTPIIALVDATEVIHITTDARKIFYKASHIPNFLASVVAAQNIASAQAARVLSLMVDENQTHILPTIEEAHAHAVQLTRQAYA